MADASDDSAEQIPTTSSQVRTKRVKFALTSDTHYGFGSKTHKFHMRFLAKLWQAIQDEGVAAVIHAGDWSCNQQHQFMRTMKMFRQYIPKEIPILAVRGNHDLWDWPDGYKVRAKRHWGELKRIHEKWFFQHNIHHLEEGEYVVDDVIVCGFDGWYGQANPPTNDKDMIVDNIEGCPAMIYHSSRAYKELNRVLATDTSKHAKAICVTHFPPIGGDRKNGYDPKDLSFSANPKYLQPIVDKFDVLCMGHSHQRVDRMHKKCRLLNCGSDYNKPEFLIFEI